MAMRRAAALLVILSTVFVLVHSNPFHTYTWCIYRIHLTNIPSYDTAPYGDADGSLSDVAFTLSTSANASVFSYMDSSYYYSTSGVSELDYVGTSYSTPYMYESSYSGTQIYYCIPMTTKKSNSAFDAMTFWMSVWNINTAVANDLIATVPLTSMASSCKTSCENFNSARSSRYYYTGCYCPTGVANMSVSITSQTLDVEVYSVMWVLVDGVSIVTLVILPVTIGLSFLAPIAEALIFAKEDGFSLWNVIRNIFFMLLGGFPTALIYTLFAVIGRFLFGDSTFGVSMFKGIRYHIAPFGKTLSTSYMGRGRVAMNNDCCKHGARMAYAWPLTVVWGVFWYILLILQFVLALATVFTIIGVPFAVFHAKQLVFLFAPSDFTSDNAPKKPQDNKPQAQMNMSAQPKSSYFEEQKGQNRKILFAGHGPSQPGPYQAPQPAGETDHGAPMYAPPAQGYGGSAMPPIYTNEPDVPAYIANEPAPYPGSDNGDAIAPPPYNA